MKKLNIGILTSSESYNQPLIDAIKERGHSVKLIDPFRCYQLVTESESGYDRLYLDNGTDEPERITAGSLDAIIPRLGSGGEYGFALLRFFTENLGIYSPVEPYGLAFASNKAYAHQRLSAMGIRTPRTMITHRPAAVKWILNKLGGKDWVIKSTHGSQGTGVAIAREPRSAASLFEFVFHQKLKVIIQAFIDADGKDIRAWVVGDKVVAAMQRTAAPGGWKANLAQNGTGTKIELSDDLKELAVKAAKAIGLNVCGVDIMIDKETQVPYIVELNGNPGFKIVDVIKYNPATDIVKFVEENYNKKPAERSAMTPDQQRIEALTDDLRAARSECERLTKDNKTLAYGREFWLREHEKLERLIRENGLNLKSF